LLQQMSSYAGAATADKAASADKPTETITWESEAEKLLVALKNLIA